MTGHRSAQGDLAADAGWDLLSLTPEYKEKEHKVYVDTLRKIIDKDGDKRVRNIALSGSYGVGKSSILDGLLREYPERIIMLSLPTLAPVKPKKLQNSLGERAGTKTNQIQQEIVKQLLYREDPSKMPASRFRRIESLRWWRVVAISVISAVVLTILFMATGWMDKLALATAIPIGLGRWLPFWFFLIALLATVFLQYLAFGRIHIKQLSTGPATVSLGEGVASYFDQYLDEIIYFFQTHKELNIVVFEDIDRFNDARIFETLRELNTLINAYPNIRRRDDPVRFIYATRDSIFDHKTLKEQDRDFDRAIRDLKDPAQIEAISANRTKFFDLVIPVVPFISHQSAGDLTRMVMEGVDYTDDEALSFEGLLDIAVQTIPEMRLLTNIRNEFVVFRDRIFSGDGKKLKLTDPQLFAMMIYKSTHLADFEAIRYQESSLDKLYKKQRKMVRKNTESIQGEIRVLRDDLRSIRPGVDKSVEAGKALLLYIKRATGEAGYTWRTPEFIIGGISYQENDLITREFWETVISTDDGALAWTNRTSIHYTGDVMTFGRNSIEAAIGSAVERALWDEGERERIRSEIDEKQNDLDFLKSADMGDLMKQDRFKVNCTGESLSLATVAEKLLETKGLAYNLIRAGYIDSNFTLYTSTFHGGRFGPAATNFTIHHIKRNLMDEYFELSSADVAALIKGKPDDAMKEPVYYNINILDYLLKQDPAKADTMIRSFGSYKDEPLRMFQAYLDRGDNPEELIRRFTRVFEGSTSHLVSRAQLDDSTRLKLVSVALSGFADDMDYDELDDYLKDHYAELDVLTSNDTTLEQAKLIASWLEGGTFKATELGLLGINVQSEMIDLGLFDISVENLGVVSGDSKDLSLDTIRVARPAAFTYLVSNLEEYLDAVEGVSPTISDPDNYAPLLSGLSDKVASEQAERVIANANPRCIVETIDDVPQNLWAPLALESRVRPTFANIDALVGYSDAANDYTALSRLLRDTQVITEVQDVDEDDKERVAFKLIEIPDDMLSSKTRAALIESLDLQEPMENIPPDTDSEIYGLLVGAGHLEDSTEMYEQLKDLKWSTREGYIANSSNFQEYMTPALVGADLANLFESRRVTDEVKERVFDNLEAYLAASGDVGLAEAGEYATVHSFDVPLAVVQRLAMAGEPPEVVVPLLSIHLEDIEQGELFPILQSLDGNYAKLTVIGQARFKFADTPSNQTLLEKLKTLGTVSSVTPEKGRLWVNMRRKER